MYKVNFYRTSTGFSDIESLLDSLSERMEKSKDARIQFEQITRYIQFLSDHGTRLGEEMEDWITRKGNRHE